jgi:hypothetical protein
MLYLLYRRTSGGEQGGRARGERGARAGQGPGAGVVYSIAEGQEEWVCLLVMLGAGQGRWGCLFGSSEGQGRGGVPFGLLGGGPQGKGRGRRQCRGVSADVENKGIA